MAGVPFGLSTGPGTNIEKDDVSIVEAAEVLNFEGAVNVIPDGDNKATVTVIGSDVFVNALFDDECNPLFSKDEDGTVELLEACT